MGVIGEHSDLLSRQSFMGYKVRILDAPLGVAELAGAGCRLKTVGCGFDSHQ